jgi:hypothetical protein
MPPNGVSGLLYKGRKYYRLEDMRQARPAGAMEVALDTNTTGSKSYTFFQDHSQFFSDTFVVVHRNFYEIIPPQHPCCLYFDLEHYTTQPGADDKLQSTLQLIQQSASERWDARAQCWESVVIFTAARPVPTGYKHSYHPKIGFSCNHGAMRDFAREILTRTELQALDKHRAPCSLLDVSVYNQNQAFRLIHGSSLSQPQTSYVTESIKYGSNSHKPGGVLDSGDIALHLADL